MANTSPTGSSRPPAAPGVAVAATRKASAAGPQRRDEVSEPRPPRNLSAMPRTAGIRVQDSPTDASRQPNLESALRMPQALSTLGRRSSAAAKSSCDLPSATRLRYRLPARHRYGCSFIPHAPPYFSYRGAAEKKMPLDRSVRRLAKRAMVRSEGTSMPPRPLRRRGAGVEVLRNG